MSLDKHLVRRLERSTALSLDPQNSTDKDAPTTAHDIEILMNSLKQVQTALAELKEAVITANIDDKGESMINFAKPAELFEEFISHSEPVPEKAVPTGLIALDKILDGFYPGRLYAIGGRPGMGKTSLMLQLALNIARNPENKQPVYIFSFEMSAGMIAKRLASLAAGAPGKFAFERKLSEFQINALAAGAEALSDLDINICDDIDISAKDICDFCRTLKSGVIFIDYIQLLQYEYKPLIGKEACEWEMDYVLRHLKDASEKSGIPIIILSQVARSVEEQENRRPQLMDLLYASDFYFSGVIMLYRDSYYNSQADDTAELIVERNIGKSGTARVKWEQARCAFTEK